MVHTILHIPSLSSKLRSPSQLIAPRCEPRISVEVYLGHSRPHMFPDIMTDGQGPHHRSRDHMIRSLISPPVVPGAMSVTLLTARAGWIPNSVLPDWSPLSGDWHVSRFYRDNLPPSLCRCDNLWRMTGCNYSSHFLHQTQSHKESIDKISSQVPVWPYWNIVMFAQWDELFILEYWLCHPTHLWSRHQIFRFQILEGVVSDNNERIKMSPEDKHPDQWLLVGVTMMTLECIPEYHHSYCQEEQECDLFIIVMWYYL